MRELLRTASPKVKGHTLRQVLGNKIGNMGPRCANSYKVIFMIIID